MNMTIEKGESLNRTDFSESPEGENTNRNTTQICHMSYAICHPSQP